MTFLLSSDLLPQPCIKLANTPSLHCLIRLSQHCAVEYVKYNTALLWFGQCNVLYDRYNTALFDSKAFCRQLWVVQHHQSILHHRHYPSWGACAPPLFLQERTPPRLTGLWPARLFPIINQRSILDGNALCRQLWVLQHQQSILQHRHHPPWLRTSSTLTPRMPAHSLRSGRKALHKG